MNPNRGLEGIVEYLEEVYETTLSSGQSLKEGGKSRADLWAFAAIKSVDFGIKVNNDACRGVNNPMRSKKTVCLQDIDDLEKCLTHADPIVFQTGRRDCVKEGDFEKPYMQDKRENAPSNDLPGYKLAKFFKEDFGFEGRETVAIMGAHNMGNFHHTVTGFWYTFVTQQEDAMNNQYYRNMALRDEWYLEEEHGFSNCRRQSMANGTKGKAIWRMKAQSAFTDRTPVEWIQFKFICPNCEWVSRNKWPSGYTEGDKARDRAACNGKPADMECKPGSEDWRFVWGRDESGTSSDMGMYYDFHVDEQGFPYGCADLDWAQFVGFGNATPRNPGIGNRNYLKARTNFNVDHGCNLQPHAEPPGSQPLHEIVEEFADDKQAFMDVFVHSMAKMLANGYTGLVPPLQPPALITMNKPPKMLSTEGPSFA
jgi:hypothetical protein